MREGVYRYSGSLRFNKTIHITILTLGLLFFGPNAQADSLCVRDDSRKHHMMPGWSTRNISLVPEGAACPAGMKAIGSLISKSSVERLISNAIGALLEAENPTVNLVYGPYPFFLSAEDSVTTLCQGIDIKSRCADADGCRLELRAIDRMSGAEEKQTLLLKYSPQLRLVGAYNGGRGLSARLEAGDHTPLLNLAEGEVQVLSDKPEDVCIDATNAGEDGPDSIWIRNTGRYRSDGALFD
jgi:hypothetical protein